MYFKGSLEGIKIEDLKLKKKDKEKKFLCERLKVLDEKYKKVQPFYEAFTSEIYTPNLKEKDPLSHTINVFKYLEFDANYLLNSVDVIREKNINKTLEKYDQALLNVATKNHLDFDIAMSVTSQTNTTRYINTETIITVDDLNEKTYGAYLKAYNYTRDILIEQMLFLQGRLKIEENEMEIEKTNHSLNQIISLLANINKDMKIIKESFKGLTKYVIKDKKQGYVNNTTLLDNISYSNPNHISYVLKYVDLNQPLNPNDDITIIATDINKVISILSKNGILKEKELSILALIQNSNLSFEEIAKNLNICRKTVYNRFDSIVKKVCLYHKSKKEGN